MDFTQDGRLAASASRICDDLLLWEFTTGEPVMKMRGARLREVRRRLRTVHALLGLTLRCVGRFGEPCFDRDQQRQKEHLCLPREQGYRGKRTMQLREFTRPNMAISLTMSTSSTHGLLNPSSIQTIFLMRGIFELKCTTSSSRVA